MHFTSILLFPLVPLSSPVFHNTAGRKLKNEYLAEWFVEDWRGRVSWWEVSMLSSHSPEITQNASLTPRGQSSLIFRQKRDASWAAWKIMKKAHEGHYIFYSQRRRRQIWLGFKGPLGTEKEERILGQHLAKWERESSQRVSGWQLGTERGQRPTWSWGKVGTALRGGLCWWGQHPWAQGAMPGDRAESQRLVEPGVSTYYEPPGSISKGEIRSLPWYMLWFYCVPQKDSSHSNPQYLWMWPYLMRGSLQMKLGKMRSHWSKVSLKSIWLV